MENQKDKYDPLKILGSAEARFCKKIHEALKNSRGLVLVPIPPCEGFKVLIENKRSRKWYLIKRKSNGSIYTGEVFTRYISSEIEWSKIANEGPNFGKVIIEYQNEGLHREFESIEEFWKE